MKNYVSRKIRNQFLALALIAAMAISGIPMVNAQAATTKGDIVSAEDLPEGVVISGAVRSTSEPIYAVAKSTSGVWIHSTQSMSSSSRICVLGYHQSVKVIEASDDHSYVKVELNYNGYSEGYILEDADNIYLTTASAQKDGWTEGSAATKYQIRVKDTVTHGLNVHNVPGVGYNSMGQLRAGATAPVVAYSSEWVEIRFKNNTTGRYIPGYVSRAYVDLVTSTTKYPGTSNVANVEPETAEDNMKNVTNKNVMVKTSSNRNLNVHISPSISSKVFASLKQGSMVTAVSYTANWVAVEFLQDGDRVTGYVYRKYTKFVSNSGRIRLSKVNKTVKRRKSMDIALYGVRHDSVITVKWASSNKSVATVNAFGRVKGLRKGKTTITCKYTVNGVSKKIRTKVTVK
ncbi:MAG: Ig-like domain-containing protein [Lachnospiraceae bacterium]|nr:Ig-like domain-containing protein [Lachnospiraceae bacterium]